MTARRPRQSRLALPALLIAFGLALGPTTHRSWGHVDPPACDATGVSIVLEAFRADQTTVISLTETVSECETVCFRTVLSKPIPSAGPDRTCAFEAGTLTITTPDGVTHDVTPPTGVPCLGGTDVSEGCVPGVTSVTSDFQCYMVREQDIMDATLDVDTGYADGTSHSTDDDLPGFVTAGTMLNLEVEFCDEAAPDCMMAICDPALGDPPGPDPVRVGLCTTTPLPDSGPCPDTDGDVCTTPGCEAGVCVQAHLRTECPVDACNTGLCDPISGQCLPAPDSSPCPDEDGSLCTTPGCEAGVCVQTHILTSCVEDQCNTGACDPVTGLCIPEPVSTPCELDGNVCTVDHCDGFGSCVFLENSTLPECDEEHFKCYATRPGRFPERQVTLVDQFGRSTATVLRPRRFCNPVDKNGEGIVDPTAHLNCYSIMESGFRAVTVAVENQFGEQTLTVTRAETLCLPAIKDEMGMLDDLETHHFKCYRARARGFQPIQGVRLVDQFEDKNTIVLTPRLLCTPVDKNGEDPTAPDSPGHLTCFKIKDAPGQPAFDPVSADVEDQFVQQDLLPTRRADCRRVRLLCVPSAKRLLGTN